MIAPDLSRSFQHFKKHIALGHVKISVTEKIILSMLFFVLLPFSLLSYLFSKNTKDKKVLVLDYGEKEPYRVMKQALSPHSLFKLYRVPKFFIPVLPRIYINDIITISRHNLVWLIQNLYFLGALSLKISKYYFMWKKSKLSKMIVMQEYSFYMSYLTRVIENENGKLYNIQHGIPGETYCYFRFSKSFIWGEHYRQVYIKQNAERNQFIVSGSIVHNFLNRKRENETEDIDILYVMQGKIEGVEDVIEALEKVSKYKKVLYIQHPRYYVKNIDSCIPETKENIYQLLMRSKIVVSHYSTALLDAVVLGKKAISYLKKDDMKNHVDYLPQSNIVNNKNLLENILILDNTSNAYSLNEYIQEGVDPIGIIRKELNA
jgi:hypothetical protein